MIQREEVWQQLEARAASNPAYRDAATARAPPDLPGDEPTVDLTYQRVEQGAKEARKQGYNASKPLLRKKSELPADTSTVKALIEHKRADAFLPTPPDVNQC
ncbi:serine/threonine-protein phosphatase 2A 56 kDa regulatory subunit delta isoform-like [Ostrinia furnacalis]|nr:serine/threonine-protein phosphatase 2A 56 kDa regulatory subunit delta isoform-like [Ostrinia furnacalis]